MRRFLGTMAFLVIPVALIVWVVIGHHQKEIETKRQKEEREAAHERVKQAIRQLASAHNAVDDWRKNFASKGPVGRVYSAELSPVLRRADERPLLFIADVQDVAGEGNRDVCSFLTKINLSRELKLILECSSDQAIQVMHGASGEKYAVVGRISSVGSSVEERSGDETAQSDVKRGRFTANGKCEGLVSVGKDYYDDFFEIISTYR